ncbi:hypothetical protein [Oryza sativa Japonica Group]|uniref:Uncharacterized protein n=3 Tax=Oryza sativa subsp. japonica TaxID=39947 RepID=Q5VR17_ORYSJ|nr:hypothetical protein [Oryza sativa Japonica Group]
MEMLRFVNFWPKKSFTQTISVELTPSSASMAAFLHLAILVSLLAAGATANNGYTTPSPPPPPQHTPPPSPPPPAPAAHQSSDKVLVRVEGKVYCQSCEHRNSWSLDGARPLRGAEVSVTCRDAKNRAAWWRLAVADESGYFLAEFGVTRASDFLGADPRGACYARLLSSPDRKCDGLTNINAGMVGAPLRDEGKRWPGQGYDNVVYAAGPLAFRPANCPPKHY